MLQVFFGFEHDRLTPENWEAIYDASAAKMAQPSWEEEVLRTSRLTGVFLTNEFDDPLEGFDTNRYVPCLRTDDLVFHLAKPETRQRLARCTGVEPASAAMLRMAIGKLFDLFVGRGARACAISLPPDFSPAPVEPATAERVIAAVATGKELSKDDAVAASRFVFWT